MQKAPSDENDQWYARRVPRTRTTPEALHLQFYGKGHRTSKEEGLYFIVNLPLDKTSNPEFKLGSYNDAMEKGVFIVK